MSRVFIKNVKRRKFFMQLENRKNKREHKTNHGRTLKKSEQKHFSNRVK